MMSAGSRGVLVCGAGGFATEVIAEFREQVSGVYDPFCSAAEFEGVPVYRTAEEARRHGHDTAVIAVGRPRLAQRIFLEIDGAGLRLARPMISARAMITGEHVALGDGCLVMSGTVLTEHIRLGRCCVIHMNSTIGHGATLGDFVSVMPLSAISGNVRIADGVFIGSQVFLKEGISIAEGSVIGAMSGIFRSVETPGKLWIGSPAEMKDRVV